jgi:hypothetical protein
MRVLVPLVLAAVGCSLTFDEGAPGVTLSDEPPPAPLGGRPLITVDEQVWPVRGVDGEWWGLIHPDEGGGLPGLENSPSTFVTGVPYWGGYLLRAVRLTGEPFEATVGEPAQLFNGRLYRTRDDQVTIWRPGEPWPGVVFAAPSGLVSSAFAERAFALSTAEATYVYRTDGSRQRRLAGERPLLFARGGDLLVGMRACAVAMPRTSCTHALVHSTIDEHDLDLGEIRAELAPASVVFVDDVRVVMCDEQGLYSIHFDGHINETDRAPCNINTAAGLPDGILLCNAKGLRRVRLTDGMQEMIDPRPCDGGLYKLGRPQSWAVTHPGDKTSFVCTPLGLVAVPGDGSLPRLGGDCAVHRSQLTGLGLALGAFVDDAMVLCDEGGLRRVPFDGGATTTIDPEPCVLLRTGERLDRETPPRLTRGEAWYARAPVGSWPVELTATVLAAPLDGSRPPHVLLEADPTRYLLTLAASTTDTPLYARAPPAPADLVRGSNGWLGDWQFMERGILATTSDDGKRVRWLEHAANLRPVGELRSAAIGGAPFTLQRNVVQYEEIAPGKLLVAANQALLGPQNRVVLVDEEARVARRLADSADHFYKLDADTLLVRLVGDGDRRSLAVVPLR